MSRYLLYNNDFPVAEFEFKSGLITYFKASEPSLLPMQIRNANADSFSAWLRDRSIDMNTLQHRQLMHELIGSRDKIAVALSTHMFSISDTFTCFPEHEFEKRSSLCSPTDQNSVSDFILISGDTTLRKTHIATPNASTDGSFTKTWRYEDNCWWLYKLQSVDASKTEYEISRVLRALNWDAAEYAYQGSYRKRIRSRNFVGPNEFFEPYDSLRFMFDDKSDDEEIILENLASLGPSFEHAWQRILLADAVFMNTDRHTRNFGVIRSSENGDILRLAPNFDNNQAYKANPGGTYSPSMFKNYIRSTDYDYHAELQQLVAECSKHPYLSDIVSALTSYC